MLETKLIVLTVAFLSHFMGKIQQNPTLVEYMQNVKGNPEIEKLVESVLEGMKQVFQTGVPEIGIPKLDPFGFDYWSTILEFPSIPLSGDLVLQAASLSGISNFDITKLDIDINGNDVLPFSYDSEVTFKNIGFFTTYELSGTANNSIDLASSGILAIELKDLKMSLSLKTGSHCGIFILDQLDFGLSLKKSNILLTGLLKDNKLSQAISNLVSFLLPHMVTDNSEDLNALISPQVMKFVNKVSALLFFEAPSAKDENQLNFADMVERFINTALNSTLLNSIVINYV